jgi:hypothetical protein
MRLGAAIDAFADGDIIDIRQDLAWLQCHGQN